MATKQKKAGTSETTSRSKVVGVRLDPKLRYLTELAARKQRRSLSSFIEWAVEETLKREVIRETDVNRSCIAEEAGELWDVDEADRFAKLAFRYPELLTHDEQLIWKLVRENGHLWDGRFASITNRWVWETEEFYFNFARLRENWDLFKAVAKGDQSPDALPSWDKSEPLISFDEMGNKPPPKEDHNG